MLRAAIPKPQEVREAGARLGDGIGEGIDAMASELRAARHALPVSRRGVRNFRKWLGWASYRFAAWVNPEIEEPW